MKNKTYKFPVLIEKDEDGIYVARVPDLTGCNTQARSIPELLKRVEEAIELYMEAKAVKKKEFNTLEFVGVHEVEVVR
mgnify:CR=1 FL=1